MAFKIGTRIGTTKNRKAKNNIGGPSKIIETILQTRLSVDSESFGRSGLLSGSGARSELPEEAVPLDGLPLFSPVLSSKS